MAHETKSEDTMHPEAIWAGFTGLVGLAFSQSTNEPDLQMRGCRFPPLRYGEMTPEQKIMTDHILAGERGTMHGPYNVLLRSPEMGDLAQRCGAYLRFHSSIPKKLNEFAILMTARFWNCQFVWHVHRGFATEAGLSASVIDAVALGQRPNSMDPAEEIVYEFCNELLNTRQVSNSIFNGAKKLLQERGVVDLIGVMAYYQLASMLLNVDQYPLPEGSTAELKPLPLASR